MSFSNHQRCSHHHSLSNIIQNDAPIVTSSLSPWALEIRFLVAFSWHYLVEFRLAQYLKDENGMEKILHDAPGCVGADGMQEMIQRQ